MTVEEIVFGIMEKPRGTEETPSSEPMEEEEDDDLELFGGYDSFRSYNSSAGSESSSYLEESSEAENEDREAGELPTSPLHLFSSANNRALDGSGSEPGAFTVASKRERRQEAVEESGSGRSHPDCP